MNPIDAIAARPLEDLLPHRAPMILLSRALGMRGEDFACAVDITPQSPFFDGRGVPAWVGLEYMAQTVAALAGCEGAQAGRGARPGLLLGSRDFAASAERFEPGATLTVLARKVLRQDGGVSAVECRIVDAGGAELVRAQLTVIEMPDMAALDRLGRP